MREVADVHRELYAEHGELYGEDVAVKIERCLAVSDGEAGARPSESRAEYRDRCEELLDGVDLLLTPTLACVAPPTGIGDAVLRESADPQHAAVQHARLAGAGAALRSGGGRPAGLAADRRAGPVRTRLFWRPERCWRPSFEGRPSSRNCRQPEGWHDLRPPFSPCLRSLRLHRLRTGPTPARPALRAPANLKGIPPARGREPGPDLLAHALLRVERGARREALPLRAGDQPDVRRERDGLGRRDADEPGRRRSRDPAVDHRQPVLPLRARPRDRRQRQRRCVEQLLRVQHALVSAVPTQLPAGNGYVRWSTVDGATSYDVWWQNLDVGGGVSKTISTITNVADEREYYSLPQRRLVDQQGRVASACRPARPGHEGPGQRPADRVVRPVEPCLHVDEPELCARRDRSRRRRLRHDVDSAEPRRRTRSCPRSFFPATSRSAAAPTASRRLAPRCELFRVYVFSDRDCVNVVYKGAVVGSPAYAPRITGPLQLPGDTKKLAAARVKNLSDGVEGKVFSGDGAKIATTESQGSSTFTATLIQQAGRRRLVVGQLRLQRLRLLRFRLVRHDDHSRRARHVPGLAERTGCTRRPVGHAVADRPLLLDGRAGAVLRRGSAGCGSIRPRAGAILRSPTTIETSRRTRARAGRIASFGKTSEPVVTSSGTPYASGLSTKGRLVAATTRRPVFAAPPLVAWQPALGASAYEVQWSKKAYPWRPEGNLFTFSTSANLPLKPGSWYYRVRGIDLSLPTGAAQMTWSEQDGPRHREAQVQSRQVAHRPFRACRFKLGSSTGL